MFQEAEYLPKDSFWQCCPLFVCQMGVQRDESPYCETGNAEYHVLLAWDEWPILGEVCHLAAPMLAKMGALAEACFEYPRNMPFGHFVRMRPQPPMRQFGP